MSEPLKVTDSSQKYKILLGIAVFALLLVLIIREDKGILGAVDIEPNLTGTSTVVSVTSTSQGVRFALRSQAIVRQFQNTGVADIFLDFGTSTNLTAGGRGAFLLQGSSTIIMSIDAGTLHRGDVYASSSGTETNNLRLYQFP